MTIEKVLAYLGLADNQDNRDKVEPIMDGVLSLFWNILGKDLTLQEHTQKYSGGGERHIFLDNYPVNSITSLQLNEGTGKTPNRVDIENDYVLQGDEGMITFTGSYTPRGYDNIKVVYQAGYSDENMPKDLVQALNTTVKSMYDNRERNADGIRTESIDDHSITFDKGSLPDFAKQVLNRYEKMYV